jgi:diguanylate cyclase (GGDEF)-like protein
LRIRSIFVAAAAALALLALAISVASQVLIQRFDAIEAAQTESKVLQALHALEADLNQLAVSARDYAEWDDAHQFVTSSDPEFLRANFSFDSLNGMQVDVIAILDGTGAILYSAHIDAANSGLRPMPADFQPAIAALRTQATSLRALSSSRRMLRTPQHLLAFSIVAITRSDLSGGTGAALFFGRLLEEDDLERIRQTSQLNASLLPAAAATGGAHFAVDAAGTSIAQARTLDDLNIQAQLTIRDWRDAPLATLSVVAPRDIGALGRDTTGLLMGTIAVLVAACAGVFVILLARLQRHWQQRIALKEQHERILDSLEEIIALVDPRDGRLCEANAALLRALDYTTQDLPTLQLQEVYVDIVPEMLASGDFSGLRECRIRARDGHLIDAEINVTILGHAALPLLCIVARDVTQRRLAEQRLHESQSRLAHLAEHDELTGLPNRQYLHTHLPQLLNRSAGEEQSLALLYIDVDHFKNLNDSQGHGVGDQLLKIIARRLRADTSAEDVVLRISGDEFVVLAPLEDALQGSKALAQRLLAGLQAPIVYEELNFSLTASIGVAIYPQDGIDSESLLKHADIALFQAKERGRNCFQMFASDMNIQVSEHVLLEQALRRAINTEQIHIEYQPLVDLQTGRLVSFEALARWRHPDMGLIPPGRFIPVAEKSGLIVPLGEQIVRNVILQLREWQLDGLALAPVAINVAPLQFERTDFATFVHETALQFDVDPKLVAFEVTESALLQNSNKHIVAVDTLRHAGSRVYIDDFGTGFSNLSYLKTLPVDAVKIDQSFIRAIDTDASDVAIVTSVIAMARQLRLDTIAEGIETAAQAERLRELGCKYGQGYYFSRPMPAAQCRALLEQLGVTRRLTETVKIRALRKVAG